MSKYEELGDWVKTHENWREIAKEEEVIYIAIQLHGHLFSGGRDTEGRKVIDYEAIHHWLGELFSVLNIYGMSEQEKQGVVDRQFAYMISDIGELEN